MTAKTALLFGGQGSEPPWIAPELVASAHARDVIAAASAHAGCDVARLLVRGGSALAKVEVLQPAFVAACLAAAAALADAGVTADVVCGHSLGELAAWAAGGHVAPVDAVAAAAVRGRLMAREARRNPGGMCVVHGDVAEALAIGRTRGQLVIAAENTSTETVLAGDEAALAAVIAAGRGRRLPVEGAWHTSAMADAVGELDAALAALPRTATGAAFVCNRDGTVAEPDAVPGLLAGQLVRPVRWIAATRTLRALGVTRFVVAGPGKFVRATLRANLGDVDVRLVDSERDLARAVAA